MTCKDFEVFDDQNLEILPCYTIIRQTRVLDFNAPCAVCYDCFKERAVIENNQVNESKSESDFRDFD